MATIKDVAALAGVSVSTVSYALNGTRSISEGRKAVIREAARTLGYQPRASARSLASGKTHILAILFPSVEHGIGLPEIGLILEASRSAQLQGYHLVIWALQGSGGEELEKLAAQSLVDGIIMMEVHRADPRIPVLQKARIPFILLGRDDEQPDETYIDIDFHVTMLRCLSWLKEQGRRRVVFINQSEKSFLQGYGPVVRTHEAFRALCREMALDGEEHFCASNGEAVRDKTLEILERPLQAQAFVVMNDKALPGVIAGVGERGLCIPRDVIVVSIVSSLEAAHVTVPPVPVFEMDSHRLMDTTVSQLVAKIEGRLSETPERLIPCALH